MLQTAHGGRFEWQNSVGSYPVLLDGGPFDINNSRRDLELTFKIWGLFIT